MITLHHLNNSRSQRVLWLLEELGLEYEVKRYQRDAKTMLAPPELRTVHPLGKSPVITDGATTVAESGAIVEYLIETHGAGRLVPADRLRYLYWLHFAEGTAMPPLLMALVFKTIESAPAPFFVKPIVRSIASKVRSRFIQPNLKNNFDFVEQELGKSEWFAGPELTGADIQMSFPLEGAAARAPELLGPRSRAFLDKIHARPAYQKALARGGEFRLL